MLSKKAKSAAHKRRLMTLSALLLINGGVAHILINQIMTKTQGETLTLVKDVRVSAQDAGAISSSDEIKPIVDAKPTITTYTVASGDTISGIAEKFDVSVNTIRWANDLDAKGKIAIGDTLTILPITGIQYKIKSGDTISGIAKKFDADAAEITHFNALEGETLKVGSTLIIPDGEPVATAPKAKAVTEKKVIAAPKIAATSSVTKSEGTDDHSEHTEDLPPVKSTSTKTSSGYFTHPIPSSILTQGLHGYNSVDFGAPIGTTVLAAASGKVIVIKGGNAWNGGYGNYIVIEHDNGTQTLYAHLSKIEVTLGESVSKGEEIAKSGNTGRSTGPHLHFEVRGGTNPWVGAAKGTHY